MSDTHVTYRVNGKVYEVPKAEADGFRKFVDETWNPNLPTKFTIENDKGESRQAHVPATLKSISFSIMLAEWADQHWSLHVKQPPTPNP